MPRLMGSSLSSAAAASDFGFRRIRFACLDRSRIRLGRFGFVPNRSGGFCCRFSLRRGCFGRSAASLALAAAAFQAAAAWRLRPWLLPLWRLPLWPPRPLAACAFSASAFAASSGLPWLLRPWPQPLSPLLLSPLQPWPRLFSAASLGCRLGFRRDGYRRRTRGAGEGSSTLSVKTMSPSERPHLSPFVGHCQAAPLLGLALLLHQIDVVPAIAETCRSRAANRGRSAPARHAGLSTWTHPFLRHHVALLDVDPVGRNQLWQLDILLCKTRAPAARLI